MEHLADPDHRSSQIQVEYKVRICKANVTAGWKAGYQKWICSSYWSLLDRSIGARGEELSTKVAEAVALFRGNFTYSGDELK